MKSLKHKLSSSTIEKWILGFILVTVLFQIIASLYPTATTAATTLNTSGFPLASLLLSGGAIWYLVGAGLIILVYKSFNSKK